MNDIHQLKPMIEIGIFDTQLPKVVVVILFFLFITILLHIRRHKKQQTIQITKPEETKDGVITKYIQMLKDAEHKLQENNFQDYFLEATKIIKSCISDVYDIKIKELTTKEISKTSTLPQNIKTALLLFLKYADKEKFGSAETADVLAKQISQKANSVLILMKKEYDK